MVAANQYRARQQSRRVTFRADQLQLLDGRLFVKTSGLELGRMPPNLPFSALTTLTITRAELAFDCDELVRMCTGPCGQRFRIRHLGLRHMGDGMVRNQPQCPTCRARYESTSRDRRTRNR